MDYEPRLTTNATRGTITSKPKYQEQEGSRGHLLKGCTLCSTQSFPLFSKDLTNLQVHLGFSEYMKENRINVSDKLHLKEWSKYLNDVQKQQGTDICRSIEL